MPENVFLIPKKETTAPADYELRVAAYCRVSTIREEQLGSLENQIAYYTHYISDKPGWRLVSAYYDRASGMRVSKSGVSAYAEGLRKRENRLDSCQIGQPLRQRCP